MAVGQATNSTAFMRGRYFNLTIFKNPLYYYLEGICLYIKILRKTQPTGTYGTQLRQS
jgi:hypothetical protein